MSEFGTLTPDGYLRRGTVRQADMLACPFSIIDFGHYRPDGSCRCDDPLERARMIREWGYAEADFAAVRLRREGEAPQ